MIRRPPRSPLSSSSAASDVYKRQVRDAGCEIGDELEALMLKGTVASVEDLEAGATSARRLSRKLRSLGEGSVASRVAEMEQRLRAACDAQREAQHRSPAAKALMLKGTLASLEDLEAGATSARRLSRKLRSLGEGSVASRVAEMEQRLRAACDAQREAQHRSPAASRVVPEQVRSHDVMKAPSSLEKLAKSEHAVALSHELDQSTLEPPVGQHSAPAGTGADEHAQNKSAQGSRLTGRMSAVQDRILARKAARQGAGVSTGAVVSPQTEKEQVVVQAPDSGKYRQSPAFAEVAEISQALPDSKPEGSKQEAAVKSNLQVSNWENLSDTGSSLAKNPAPDVHFSGDGNKDLAAMCRSLGLSVEEFLKMHDETEADQLSSDMHWHLLRDKGTKVAQEALKRCCDRIDCKQVLDEWKGCMD
eukprot:TRINITY_DN1128_c0_g1_i2.p1 TRINITY_DN1128_c0_g1~~TRINITY_DN1128_c0_g1_i2.p1  ORF type:complete len:419 (-),score=98.61 TRINITY_DN1128_c0_g1_i2:102-1358(-)